MVIIVVVFAAGPGDTSGGLECAVFALESLPGRVTCLALKKLAGKKGNFFMSRTDIIADALTSIRNASTVKKESVDIFINSVIKAVLGILKEEGYIENFQMLESKYNKARVYLKYDQDKNPAITGLKRVSKPGLKVYVKKDKIPIVLRGQGVAIISTSSGILTNKAAKEKGLGGEFICSVY